MTAGASGGRRRGDGQPPVRGGDIRRSGRGGGPLGGLLAAAGGLLLAGATTAGWVSRTEARELAGVEISDVVTTGGAEFAPLALPLGVAAVLGGLLLVVLPVAMSALRRLVGALVALVGGAGLAAVALGLRAAAGHEGALRATPGLAVLGALAVVFGGAAALRRPARHPVLSARHDIDTGAGAGEDAQEWDLAAAEDDEPR